MILEAEIGLMHLQAKEHKDCQMSPEARREARNRFSSEPSEGISSTDSLILDF